MGLYWGNIRVIWGLYWGNIRVIYMGILAKKMEITIMGCIGFSHSPQIKVDDVWLRVCPYPLLLCRLTLQMRRGAGYSFGCGFGM